MALTMQRLAVGLLPWAFLLPPGGWADEIIGGHEAEPHSRPYMAFLEIQCGHKTFRCGGFLVAKDFVLTAAHCQGDFYRSIKVTLGAHNIEEEETTQQLIPAECQIPHPQYKSSTDNNDIMLLKLQGKAQLNRYVDFIKLPAAEEGGDPKTKCSVAGWGRTSPKNKQMSDTLREADVVAMPDASCWRNHDGPYSYYDATIMMCVRDRDKGSSSFRGDSGGPLVCGKKGQGIVSWGSKNGTPPAIYTRVSAFIPWIQKIMRKLQP